MTGQYLPTLLLDVADLVDRLNELRAMTLRAEEHGVIDATYATILRSRCDEWEALKPSRRNGLAVWMYGEVGR